MVHMTTEKKITVNKRSVGPFQGAPMHIFRGWGKRRLEKFLLFEISFTLSSWFDKAQNELLFVLTPTYVNQWIEKLAVRLS